MNSIVKNATSTYFVVISILLCFVSSLTAQQSGPRVQIVKNSSGYSLTSTRVLVKSYQYTARQLKVTKIPALKFDFTRSAQSHCSNHESRKLVKGYGGNPSACVEQKGCDVIKAWLPDGHPVYFVPVMINVLSRCNGVSLSRKQLDALTTKAVETAINYRYDDALR